jgi:hypothetical protein
MLTQFTARREYTAKLERERARFAELEQQVLYLLYWYCGAGTLLALLLRRNWSASARASRSLRSRCSVYLLFWYKSTHTDT